MSKGVIAVSTSAVAEATLFMMCDQVLPVYQEPSTGGHNAVMRVFSCVPTTLMMRSKYNICWCTAHEQLKHSAVRR